MPFFMDDLRNRNMNIVARERHGSGGICQHPSPAPAASRRDHAFSHSADPAAQWLEETAYAIDNYWHMLLSAPSAKGDRECRIQKELLGLPELRAASASFPPQPIPRIR
jgi:hypothetical protein